jgi:hypothetical protein
MAIEHTQPFEAARPVALHTFSCRVEIFAELAEVPLAHVSPIRESEREIQECVMLRSPVAEVQVVATPWRFWFFN